MQRFFGTVPFVFPELVSGREPEGYFLSIRKCILEVVISQAKNSVLWLFFAGGFCWTLFLVLGLWFWVDCRGGRFREVVF